MTPSIITVMICSGIVSFLFAVVLIGVKRVLQGQCDIRTEATEGRKALHAKIDPIAETVTKLTQCHEINHPGQLKN